MWCGSGCTTLLHYSCHRSAHQHVWSKWFVSSSRISFCWTSVSCVSRLQVWFSKRSIFDLQGHYRQIRRHCFGVKRAYHYSVVWQSSLPKGTVITSLSAFQLTPGKGIIGNHPCNAVPLSFWQLSETTARWFCPLDVKSELKTPSVPWAQHAVSYVYVCVFFYILTSIVSAGKKKAFSLYIQISHISATRCPWKHIKTCIWYRIFP